MADYYFGFVFLRNSPFPHSRASAFRNVLLVFTFVIVTSGNTRTYVHQNASLNY